MSDRTAVFLDPDQIDYLAGLTATDIRRKKRPAVDNFEPRGDPGAASAILAARRDKLAFCVEVLGRLADAAPDPDSWRASAAAELDLDN